MYLFALTSVYVDRIRFDYNHLCNLCVSVAFSRMYTKGVIQPKTFYTHGICSSMLTMMTQGKTK